MDLPTSKLGQPHLLQAQINLKFRNRVKSLENKSPSNSPNDNKYLKTKLALKYRLINYNYFINSILMNFL